MFTGIIESCTPVAAFERHGAGARLVLPLPSADWSVALGQSIAVSGTCLSVAALETGPDGPLLVFDLSSETLERTWFGSLEPGVRVNLERALQLGERLDGHMVSGHVDGVGRVAAIEDAGDGGRVFTFEAPAGFERYLVDKGSVTLDGISLTVVEPDELRFSVAIIPLTLELTHLGHATVGQPVNFEVDLVGKWVERMLTSRGILPPE